MQKDKQTKVNEFYSDIQTFINKIKSYLSSIYFPQYEIIIHEDKICILPFEKVTMSIFSTKTQKIIGTLIFL